MFVVAEFPAVCFNEFAPKLWKFFQSWEDSQRRQIGSRFAGVRSGLLSESCLFLANGAVIESSTVQAPFPVVREQLSFDECGRKTVLKGNGIEAAYIHSLQIRLSGDAIVFRRSE